MQRFTFREQLTVAFAAIGCTMAITAATVASVTSGTATIII